MWEVRDIPGKGKTCVKVLLEPRDCPEEHGVDFSETPMKNEGTCQV